MVERLEIGNAAVSLLVKAAPLAARFSGREPATHGSSIRRSACEPSIRKDGQVFSCGKTRVSSG